jgi:hypothetical protein
VPIAPRPRLKPDSSSQLCSAYGPPPHPAGKWVLATTRNYLMVMKTTYRDPKSGKELCGFTSRMGSSAPAPRLLRLKTGEHARQGGRSGPGTLWAGSQPDEHACSVAAAEGRSSCALLCRSLLFLTKPSGPCFAFSTCRCVQRMPG